MFPRFSNPLASGRLPPGRPGSSRLLTPECFVLCLRPSGLCYVKAGLFDKLNHASVLINAIDVLPLSGSGLEIFQWLSENNSDDRILRALGRTWKQTALGIYSIHSNKHLLGIVMSTSTFI